MYSKKWSSLCRYSFRASFTSS